MKFILYSPMKARIQRTRFPERTGAALWVKRRIDHIREVKRERFAGLQRLIVWMRNTTRLEMYGNASELDAFIAEVLPNQPIEIEEDV